MSNIGAGLEWLDSNLGPILAILVCAIICLGYREWKCAKKRRAQLTVPGESSS